jgi:hypothetical protein
MTVLTFAVLRPTRQRCLENAATEQVAAAATFVASNRISDWCSDYVLTRRCRDSTSKIPGTYTPSISQCLILISNISEKYQVDVTR